MDRHAYARRAAEPHIPTVEERLASLESWRSALRAALEDWVKEHNRVEKRKWETHAAAHEAMQDHIYALDQRLRRAE